MASIGTAPAPVSVAEAKAYLRITNSEEDALIAGFLRSASELCEAFTGLVLTQRQVVEVLGGSLAWTRLRAGPVQAIDLVTGLAPDGTETALPISSYAIDIDANGDGWVRLSGSEQPERVRVEYRAGIAADWNGVPEPLRQGVVRLAAHFYLARDSQGAAPPAAVSVLWRPWRRLRLS